MKKGNNKVYIFRHGQTTYNRDGRFTGWLDAKLTKKGKAHAKIIAKKMKNKRFQVAIRTRLSRSKDTLSPVLEDHPECVFIIQDDRMIERSYGKLQGMLHKDFIKKIGKQEYDLRVQGDAIENLEPKLRKQVEEFLGTEEYRAIHRGWSVAAPEGESFADVEKRVRAFIRDLKKFIRKHHVNVAISAHGNSIRLFRKIMEKASIQEAVSWNIPYDKVFEYKI